MPCTYITGVGCSGWKFRSLNGIAGRFCSPRTAPYPAASVIIALLSFILFSILLIDVLRPHLH